MKMKVIKLQVREVAESKGISTPYKLSRKANILLKQAQGLWDGTTHNVSLPALNTIAHALKVEPLSLLVEVEEEIEEELAS